MTNKDLILKLNSLKEVNPDEAWLKSNRELLLSQISNAGAENIPAWKAFFINFSSVAKAASQPAYALGAFVLMLLTGSFFGPQIFSRTKPNDSLYIARIISEKVKINTTFDSETRDKLAVQYAAEHAQDISAVLADPKFNTEANKEQVAQLSDSFNKEVTTVKNRISRIPAIAAKTAANNVPAAAKPDKAELVMADSSKDGKGIQLQVNPTDKAAVVKAEDTAKGTSTKATTTNPVATSTVKSSDADKILDEATKLFDKKDYNKALDKLKEVDDIIK